MTQMPANFSIGGFLKIARTPNLLMIAFTQFLLIYTTIYKVSQNSLVFIDGTLLVLSTTLIAAAGYLINDYYDVKIDLINKPERVVVGKILKRRVIMITHFILNFIGISSGFYLSIRVGLATIFTAFFLWWYSNYLKRLPFIGNMVVAMITSLSLLIVAIHFKSAYNIILVYSGFALLFTLVREIIKDMEDLRGDATHGCMTLPIVWGLRPTKNLLYIIITLVLMSLIYLGATLSNLKLSAACAMMIILVIMFKHLLKEADTKNQFGKLSMYCKLLMLTGVCSLLLLD
jgi:4-hydroxybenzoate polyprenyltransferase